MQFRQHLIELLIILECTHLLYASAFGQIDLESPIDIESPTTTHTSKAKIVVVNNRKEARLPFYNPRKQFINADEISKRSHLQARNDVDESIYRPQSGYNVNRTNLEIKRTYERKINKAIRRTDELLKRDLLKNSNSFGQERRSAPLEQQLSTSMLVVGINKDSEFNVRRLPASDDNWTRKNHRQQNVDIPAFDSIRRSEKDARKPPILILEQVPVYINADVDRPQPTMEDSQSIPDNVSDDYAAVADVDRRPNRQQVRDEKYPVSEEVDDNLLKIYHSNTYREPPEVYERFPPNNFPDTSDVSHQSYFMEYSNNPAHSAVPPPDPRLPNDLVPDEPIPHAVHTVIENVAINEFPVQSFAVPPTVIPPPPTPSRAQIAFQNRLRAAAAAEALAVGALQQQAIAGLALNQQLQRIAALTALQRAAVASHANRALDAKDAHNRRFGHGHQLIREAPDHQSPSDLHISASDISYGKDSPENPNSLETLVKSEVKDTINNQIRKHINHIIANEKEDRNVDREELVKHLSFLRPHFANENGGYRMPFEMSTFAPTSPHEFVSSSESSQKRLPNSAAWQHSDVDSDFIEFILNLPDEYFERLVHMSKERFLSVMFPSLYPSSSSNATRNPPLNLFPPISPLYAFPEEERKPPVIQPQSDDVSYSTRPLPDGNIYSGHSSTEGNDWKGSDRFPFTVASTPTSVTGATQSPFDLHLRTTSSNERSHGTVTLGPVICHKGSTNLCTTTDGLPHSIAAHQLDLGNNGPLLSPPRKPLEGFDDKENKLSHSTTSSSNFVFIKENPKFNLSQNSESMKDFRNDQPYYTTISPSLFHTTLSHPKPSTLKHNFRVNLSEEPLSSEENTILEGGTGGTLIGGFEGVLRPPTQIERLKILDEKHSMAVNLLSSPPGTDTADDSHVVSPLMRRIGNDTRGDDQKLLDESSSSSHLLSPIFRFQEIPSVVKFAPPTISSFDNRPPVTQKLRVVTFPSTLIGDTKNQQFSPSNSDVSDDRQILISRNEELKTDADSVPPTEQQSNSNFFQQFDDSAFATLEKRLPSPHRVIIDEVPDSSHNDGAVGVDSISDSLHNLDSTEPGGDHLLARSRVPSPEELVSQLPEYLREAPACAGTEPTKRSFCLLDDHNYPRTAAKTLFDKHKDVVNELMSLLQTVHLRNVSLDEAAKHVPGLDPSVSCEEQERTVQLAWAQDVLGNWLTILHIEHAPQIIVVNTCSVAARQRGCRPLLLSRPLIAFHPLDDSLTPTISNFPVPVSCVYARST